MSVTDRQLILAPKNDLQGQPIVSTEWLRWLHSMSMIFSKGYINLDTSIAAADVPNNSLFRDSTSGKLRWKDSSGTSHDTY